MRHGPTWVRVALAAALLLVVVREVAVVVASYELLGPAGTLAVQITAAALVLARARAHGFRGAGAGQARAWAFVGAGVLAWSAGDMYSLTVLGDDPSPPVPSPADVGYLLFPVLVFVGLVLVLRARAAHASRFLWVDGVVAALAVAAVGAAIVAPAVLSTLGGTPLTVATTLAYPASDLVLLGFVAAAAAVSAWRLDRAWLLIGGALVAFCVADTGYLLRTVAETYAYPDPVDAGWDLAFVLLAAAAWQPASAASAVRTDASTRAIAMPLAFGVTGLGVLVLAGVQPVAAPAVGLAALAIVGVMVRLALTFRENRDMLASSQAEALTDALTGLPNRRAMSRELAAALARGPHALVIFDLDGFKHYNDTYGHPAGDQLLCRLAAALQHAVERHGVAFRMGGDEFCALLRVEDDHPVETLIRAASEALSERGDGFSIGSSHGAVVLPVEATEATEALRLADQRLYEHKQSGRVSAGHQSRNVLLRALVARHPTLAGHSRDVARLAGEVADALGLDQAEVEQIRDAAELHDVGKVGIPDAILGKAGPLDDEEWTFVRRHTLIGERIIGGAPSLAEVARMVRASHERWDGGGYPDGLRGEEIPLGARIVAVADAFDAIVSDRPYARARSRDEALEELRRCAGTQFDPSVVEAFCRVAQRAGAPA